MKNIPNILTFFRLGAAPLLALLIAIDGETGAIVSAVIFLLAGITDFFDGRIARAMNAESRMGRILDPIADKILVVTALVLLVWTDRLGGLHIIPVLIILWRDMLVAGLREFTAGEGGTVAVSNLARVKTGVQMVALFVLLLAPAIASAAVGWIGLGLLWVAAALTVASAYEYFREKPLL